MFIVRGKRGGNKVLGYYNLGYYKTKEVALEARLEAKNCGFVSTFVKKLKD